jgi:hypothetical protein
MGRRQPNKTKHVLKLPADISKGKVISAYSTSVHVSIEGYTGTIHLITSKEIPSGVSLCRDPDKTGGKSLGYNVIVTMSHSLF